jgi:hypothetical protein
MSDIISSERQLEALIEDVRKAPALNRDLFVKIIEEGGTRLWNLNGRSRAPLSRLIEQDAWIDASLALIEFDSPPWKLRRLLREDGEWFCSLSKCPSVPLELDDTADARHEDAALAILAAFLEAERKAMTDSYEEERGGVMGQKAFCSIAKISHDQAGKDQLAPRAH